MNETFKTAALNNPASPSPFRENEQVRVVQASGNNGLRGELGKRLADGTARWEVKLEEAAAAHFGPVLYFAEENLRTVSAYESELEDKQARVLKVLRGALSEARDELLVRVRQMREDATFATEEMKKLEGDLQSVKTERDEAHAQTQRYAEGWRVAEEANDKLCMFVETTKGRKKTKKKLLRFMSAVRGQVSDVEQAWDAGLARVQELEKELAEVKKARDAGFARVQELEKELAEVKKARDAGFARVQALVKELAEVKKDAEWRLGFLKSAEQARDEALARVQALEQQIAAVVK